MLTPSKTNNVNLFINSAAPEEEQGSSSSSNLYSIDSLASSSASSSSFNLTWPSSSSSNLRTYSADNLAYPTNLPTLTRSPSAPSIITSSSLFKKSKITKKNKKGKKGKKAKKSKKNTSYTDKTVYVYDNANQETNKICYSRPVLKLLRKKENTAALLIPMESLEKNPFKRNDVVIGDLNDRGKDELSQHVLNAIKQSSDTLFILLSGDKDRVDNAKEELAKVGYDSHRVQVYIKPLKEAHVKKAMDVYENYLAQKVKVDAVSSEQRSSSEMGYSIGHSEDNFFTP